MLTLTEISLIIITTIMFVIILTDRFSIDMVALTLLLVLTFSGLVSAEDALKGFGSTVVITLLGLFIITRGLQETGIIHIIAQHLHRWGGKSEMRLIATFMLIGATLSLVMNNVAAGAMLLPATLQVAHMTGVKPSKLLMPLSFGTLVGGMTTYLTTANILMSTLLQENGLEGLNMLDFIPIGSLITMTGVLYMVFIGRHLLPDAPARPLSGVAEAFQQAPARPEKAPWALGITVVVLALAILEVFPIAPLMLAGAVGMVFADCLSVEQFYTAIEWKVIFLVAGMLPLSIALTDSGLADRIGRGMVEVLAAQDPIWLVMGMFTITMLIAQVIGGQVTALVVGPIAISSALQLGISPQAISVAVAIGCTTDFLTPFSHPVNILMMAPGGYRFSDFLRVGIGQTLVTMLALWAGMRIFWGI